MDLSDPDGVDAGRPGGSLLRQYEQRRAARERQVRERYPRLGGLLLALTGDKQTTTALRTGAVGEQRVAERLLQRCGPEVGLLFNRRLGPGRRDGDVDLIAVAPTGVHIVDVKNVSGASVRVRRTGGFLAPVREQLLVKGRDRTGWLDSLDRQRLAVEAAVDELPGLAEVPVHLAFCFIDADLPWSTPRIDGVAVLGSKQLARWLNRPGPIEEDVRRHRRAYLARRLPPA